MIEAYESITVSHRGLIASKALRADITAVLHFTTDDAKRGYAMAEQEGFEVVQNEELGHWYIVHRQMKGCVLHRNILPDQYETEEAAEEFVKVMRGG